MKVVELTPNYHIVYTFKAIPPSKLQSNNYLSKIFNFGIIMITQTCIN